MAVPPKIGIIHQTGDAKEQAGMYEPYWHLDRKPFENTTDTRFYYPGEAHQGALLKLRYVIENRHGAALLTGPSGIGKTMLVSTLLKQLPDGFAPQVKLVFPQMPSDQLLSFLAQELTGTTPAASAGNSTATIEQSVRVIRHALAENTKKNRHAVVVIDEAQLLGDFSTLETLRLLLNFELAGRPGLTLLLVGQPSLLPVLDRMTGLEERLGVKCLVRPLRHEETVSYVQHRLRVAGRQQTIFDDGAFDALHSLSRGLPRRINRLCDLALLIGYAEELTTIDAAHIEAVSEDLVTVSPE